MNVSPVRSSRGFSLIELVIVIVIIGVIGAIAIPRMTRGANSAGSSALKANLQVLRGAIELYRAEHDGKFPTLADFENQMLQYSNIDGDSFAVAPNTATGVIYGPYLAAIPAVPVGPQKGAAGVAADDASATATDGWLYTQATGVIIAHTDSAADQDAKPYSSY